MKLKNYIESMDAMVNGSSATLNRMSEQVTKIMVEEPESIGLVEIKVRHAFKKANITQHIKHFPCVIALEKRKGDDKVMFYISFESQYHMLKLYNALLLTLDNKKGLVWNECIMDPRAYNSRCCPRIYFDIDIKKDEIGDKEFSDDYFVETMELVKRELFKHDKLADANIDDYKFAITQAHSDKKYSWHTTLKEKYNPIIMFPQDQLVFLESAFNIIENRLVEGSVDRGIYKQFKGMRMAGSTKLGEDRPLRFVNTDNVRDTMIMYDDNVQAGYIHLQIERKPTTKDSTIVCKDFNEYENTDLWKCIRRLPGKYHKYEPWFKVGIMSKAEHGDKGIKIWKEFSKLNAETYDPGEIETKWDTITDPNITIATAIFWLRQENIECPLQRKRIIDYSKFETFDGRNFNDYRELRKTVSTNTEEQVIEFFGSTVRELSNDGMTQYLIKSRDYRYKVTDCFSSVMLKKVFYYRKPSEEELEEYSDKRAAALRKKGIGVTFEMILDLLDIYGYDKTEFRSEDPKVFEMYRGPMLQHMIGKEWIRPAAEIAKNSMEKVDWHLKNVLCGGDENIGLWFDMWLATVFQKRQKTGVCPVFIGKQGTGKNIVLDVICDIIGKQYTIKSCRVNKIVNNWNGQLENNVLCVMDEVGDYGAGYQQSDVLKGYITGSEIQIEKKRVNAYVQKNYTNFIVVTNNNNPVKSTEDCRRYVWINVSDIKMQDEVYFNCLAKALEDAKEAIMKKYMNYDIGAAEKKWGGSIKKLPKTELKQQQIELSKKDYEQFVDLIYDGQIGVCIEKDKYVRCSPLYKKYKTWTKESGFKSCLRSATFQQRIEKLWGKKCKPQIGDKRPYAYDITKAFEGKDIMDIQHWNN